MGPRRAARSADLHFTENLVPHDRAGNQLVDFFLDKTDASHLLMIDSDMIPPPDAPDRLAAHGRDFVTAMTPVPRVDSASGRTVVVNSCFADTGLGEADPVTRSVRRIRVAMAASCPDAATFRLAHARLCN